MPNEIDRVMISALSAAMPPMISLRGSEEKNIVNIIRMALVHAGYVIVPAPAPPPPVEPDRNKPW